ncbi:hypothetical protein ACU4GD_39550 [Cupriavidus basilensis]
MQNWLDDGQADVPPEKVRVPFMVSPTVGRVEPQSNGRGAAHRLYAGATAGRPRDGVLAQCAGGALEEGGR